MNSRISFAFALMLVSAVAGPNHATSGRVKTLAQVAGGTGGLVVDADGNLYSADFGAILGDGKTAGEYLYRIKPDGSTSVFAEGFVGASGVAIDSNGNLYQSNIRGGYVSKVSPDGKVNRFASDGFQAPVGIVIDDKGTLWMASCGSGSIQKVTNDGTSSRFVESPQLKCPNGITLYWPNTQLTYGAMSLMIRTGGDPTLPAEAVRAQIRALDPDQPVAHVQTMDTVLGDSISRERFLVMLLTVFSAIALVLALIGLMAGLLFEVSPTDPATFVAVVLLLSVALLAACYLPARRATRIDPTSALRCE